MAAKLDLQKAKAMASGKNSSIILLMVVATFAVSFSVIFSRVWYKDIGFTNKVIQKKAEVSGVLEQNVAALEQLQTNFSFLEKDGPKPEEVFRALPTSADYPAMATQLETMAALVGAKMTAATPTTAVEGEATAMGTTATSVGFNFSATGGYVNLQNLLGNLEASKRPIRINTITFSGADPTMIMTVSFTTYFQGISTVGEETEVFTDEN